MAEHSIECFKPSGKSTLRLKTDRVLSALSISIPGICRCIVVAHQDHIAIRSYGDLQLVKKLLVPSTVSALSAFGRVEPFNELLLAGTENGDIFAWWLPSCDPVCLVENQNPRVAVTTLKVITCFCPPANPSPTPVGGNSLCKRTALLAGYHDGSVVTCELTDLFHASQRTPHIEGSSHVPTRDPRIKPREQELAHALLLDSGEDFRRVVKIPPKHPSHVVLETKRTSFRACLTGQPTTSIADVYNGDGVARGNSKALQPDGDHLIGQSLGAVLSIAQLFPSNRVAVLHSLRDE